MVEPFELNSQSGTYTVSGELSSSQILAMAHHLTNRAHSQNQAHILSNPAHAKTFVTSKLQYLEHEVFCCLMLSAKHHVLGFVELFRGTIDSAAVYPREVVKEVLKFNAAAVVFTHNHPSGDAEPSSSDEKITSRLVKAMELIEVRVLDHIVVGHGSSISFAERGLL